ncbi:MAG: anaerobic glycerol-3-phosphate dehydrogenase subunit C [Smithellaceae bacterium]|nr:anaerobic glycerol-3-phosphate dehydrogenase subunit C [Smithellaceae bacterium]
METTKGNPDICIRCATCMAICPVSRVSPAFPGPKQAGPGAERFRNPKDASVDDWTELCIGCHLCETVCSSGVGISEMNLLAKAKYLDEKGRSFRDWLLTHLHRFDPLASRLAALVNPLLKSRPLRWLLDRFLGIDQRRELPRYEYPSFRQWFRRRQSLKGRKVAYFYGCYTNVHDVDVGKAVVEVLEALGWEVVIPPQDCCGIPRLGNGDFPGAIKLGTTNISSFQGVIGQGMDIIFSSSSCGLMIRHEYGRFLALPGAGEVAARIFDLFEFLNKEAQGKTLAERLSPLPGKVAYFAPCHLRALDISLPALEFLRLIPQLEVELIKADCCGLAGAFGFKKEKYDISQAIGADLALAIRDINPDLVLSDCEGCRMQIHHLTGLPVTHPIQLLRDSLKGGHIS